MCVLPAQGKSARQGKLLKKTRSASEGSLTPHNTDAPEPGLGPAPGLAPGQGQGQGLGQGPFEDALHQAVLSTLAYALTQMTSTSSPVIVELASSYREDVGLVKRWLLSDVSSQSSILTPNSTPINAVSSSATATATAKSNNDGDKGRLPLRCYLSSSSGSNSKSNSDSTATSSSSSPSLLSSRWITAVSAFTRTLATWGTLLTHG